MSKFRDRLESRDIYETEDLPEADQAYDDSEFDKNIDVIKINPKDAFNRFKGKEIEIKKQCKKLRLSTDDPLSKAKRIRAEIAELKSMAEKMDDNIITEKDPVSKDQLLLLIDGLNKQLNDLQVEEELKKVDTTIFDKNNLLFQKLQSCIKEIKSDSGGSAKTEKSSEYPSFAIQSNSQVEEVIKNIKLTNMVSRMENLERAYGKDTGTQLANIVSECGASKASVGAAGILEAVDRLAAKTSLLNGPKLTAVESRIQYVAAKLKTIETVSSQSTELDPDSHAKVAELYEIVKKWDFVIDMLPKLIESCRSLEELHIHCAKMSQSLYYLNSKQDELQAKFDRGKNAINNMQNNLPENVKTLEENINSLQARICKA